MLQFRVIDFCGQMGHNRFGERRTRACHAISAPGPYRPEENFMRKTVGLIWLAILLSLVFSCATEKRTGKGNLDFQTLLGADDSTYLPFVIETKRIEEVRDLFSKDNLPMKSYKTVFPEQMTIPPKVKYIELPAATNERVISDFFNALKPPVKLPQIQDNKVVICGPHLTALLKKSGILSELEYTRIVGPFNYFKRQDVLIECAIKGEGIPKIFSLLRNLLFSDESITVRKLNARELDWYWVSNSYDIDEPLFIFENSKHSIMIHFTAEGKIFFLDLFDTLNWQLSAK
jgi:hypothetical protein